MGKGKYIYVGSSTDMFADNVPFEWQYETFKHICKYPENKYFFQSKNTVNMLSSLSQLTLNDIDYTICTTIETNRHYPKHMNNCPIPFARAHPFSLFNGENNYVTVEPIMDFDLKPMVELIKMCKPIQVNIGADSGKNNLPEPTKEKILQLISELEKFTKVHLKKNLKRLMQ